MNTKERRIKVLEGQVAEQALAAAGGQQRDAVTPPIADLLQGRGGGSDSMFQGKAGSLKDRARAVVLLRESLVS